MRQPKPKNVAKYQDTAKFAGRPEVANPNDRVRHRETADPEAFAEATAHENERNLSEPPKKAPQSVKPDQPVTESPTRKSDDDVGGF